MNGLNYPYQWGSPQGAMGNMGVGFGNLVGMGNEDAGNRIRERAMQGQGQSPYANPNFDPNRPVGLLQHLQQQFRQQQQVGPQGAPQQGAPQQGPGPQMQQPGMNPGLLQQMIQQRLQQRQQQGQGMPPPPQLMQAQQMQQQQGGGQYPAGLLQRPVVQPQQRRWGA